MKSADMLLPGGKAWQGREFDVCRQFIQCVQEKMPASTHEYLYGEDNEND
jgi:hypothetical protein